MRHTEHARRYSIGELVNEAYRQARQITTNRKVEAVVATKILESWLMRSDRPELVRRLQTPSA